MSRTPVIVVTRFELTRTLRKPQFWVTALLLPAIIAVSAALVVAWTQDTQADAMKPVAFEYTDHSGLISETVASSLGGAPARKGAAERAKAGKIDAYLDFPSDPVRQPVTIVAQDRGIIANSDYDALARHLFAASVDATLDSPKVVELVRATPRTDVSAYAAGQPTAGLGDLIVPGLLAILLVLLVSLLGNQMLNSTVEEKENRISELLLVSLPARALITGKIVALALVGLLQIGILAVGCVIIYLSTSSWLKLDAIGIDTVVLDPVRIGVGLLLLVGGMLVMTGLLVLAGAAMPTAKDAAPYYTGVVLITIVPLYLISAILVNPDSPVVYFLTYFPLTAPMTALLLNATGTLHPLVGVGIGLALLLIGTLILRLAIRTFQRGVLEYGRPLRLRDLPSTHA